MDHDILKVGGRFLINRNIYYPVKFPDYFVFLIESFRPFHFSQLLTKTNSPIWSVLFFTLNFCLSLLIWALENIFQAPQKQVFLQIFSEMLFFFPAAIAAFFFFSFVLYLLSVLLGGKASFSQIFSIMGLSSYPLILLFIPMLSTLALIWWCFILVFSFKKVHKYSFSLAIISTVLPFLVIAAFMLATGFLKFPSDLGKISSLFL